MAKFAQWRGRLGSKPRLPPLACCSQEECESIIVRVLCRKPILYALTAAADLDDLTVFITMMNKIKVLEEKCSFWFFKASQQQPQTLQSFLPYAPCSEPHICASFAVTENALVSRKLSGCRWVRNCQLRWVSSGWEP